MLSPLTSCLASTLNGRRSAKSLRRGGLRQKSQLSVKSLDHSFDSALNSAKQLFCDKKSIKAVALDLIYLNPIENKCLNNKLTKVLISRIFGVKREPLHWITSYKSENSFEENKCCPKRGTELRLLTKSVGAFTLHNYTPIRTFKSRPEPFTGIGSNPKRSQSKDQTSIGHKKLGSIFGLKKDKSFVENEKIKEYINEENLNNEEKDRIKV